MWQSNGECYWILRVAQDDTAWNRRFPLGAGMTMLIVRGSFSRLPYFTISDLS